MYFYYVQLLGYPTPVKAASHPLSGLDAKRQKQRLIGPVHELTLAQFNLPLHELAALFPLKESANDER